MVLDIFSHAGYYARGQRSMDILPITVKFLNAHTGFAVGHSDGFYQVTVSLFLPALNEFAGLPNYFESLSFHFIEVLTAAANWGFRKSRHILFTIEFINGDISGAVLNPPVGSGWLNTSNSNIMGTCYSVYHRLNSASISGSG
jgi:hypothetical protein